MEACEGACPCAGRFQAWRAMKRALRSQHLRVLLAWLVVLVSVEQGGALPLGVKTKTRMVRRARQDGRLPGSTLTCYSLIEKSNWVTANKTVLLFAQCANNAGMSTAEKLECNRIWTDRVRQIERRGTKLNYGQVLYTYEESKLKTRLSRISRSPSLQIPLHGNFHWIDWNVTLPLINKHPQATHVRCEWKFVLKTKVQALQNPTEPSPAARLHLFNKIWVRRAPTAAGCNKNDGRLTITAQNSTGRKVTERERFCGRHHSPGEQIKQFWPETSVVTMSFRASLNNTAVGPFGYFFTYRYTDVFGGCSFNCDHSVFERYSHCDNTSLPDFLKISISESRSRSYTVSELIEGFTYATRLRQQESPDYHCIDRYPIFRQIFQRGSLPTRTRKPLRDSQRQDLTSTQFKNSNVIVSNFY